MYTWAPTNLAKMKADGTQKQKFNSISTFFARYNSHNKKIAFLEIPDNNLMVYDTFQETSTPVIRATDLEGLF